MINNYNDKSYNDNNYYIKINYNDNKEFLKRWNTMIIHVKAWMLTLVGKIWSESFVAFWISEVYVVLIDG